ncbi:MAG: IS256 family transposase [Clostridiales bacterium]|nr:IS256 family transposase [Clostridiales bacterium]
MAQYNITIDSEILHYLFLKGVKDEGMTKLLESVLNQVLQAQAAEQIKAEPYERTEEREDYRNGYYKRRLETRVGNIVLQIPRFRYGKFPTDLFQRYKRSEQGLLLALMEMVVNGVSTRKIEEITYELCGSEFSRSTISELCKNLDPIVQGWISRPLNEKRFPFIIVDAMVIKVREEGRVRQRGLLIAIGINEEGYREVLGFMVGDSESEESWGEFFSWLKQRGLHGVDLIVSDQHKGLVRAISQYFQGATWQRCQTHFMRNILDKTPKQLQKEIHGKVRAILEAPDLETARMLLKEVLEEYKEKAPKTMDILEEGFEDATAVLELPEQYRRRLRTTNGLERLNEEIRRRERVIRIFPNRESAIRLIGALLMEIDEKWGSGKRYFDMAEYFEWCRSKTQKLKEKVVSIG